VVAMREGEPSPRTILQDPRYAVYSALLLVVPLIAYLSMRFIRVGGHHPFMWPLNAPIVGLAPWALLAWSWASWRALRRSGSGLASLSTAVRAAFVATSAVSVTLCLLFVWSAARMAAYFLSS
jgi:hypothetical protein